MKTRRIMFILLLSVLLVFSLFLFTGCSIQEQVTILSIEKTGSDGNTDTYTITFTDESKFSFRVTNGETGKEGDDGASAYEIYKKYYPDYAGTEDIWLEDLISGKLDKDYITNSQCLITLTVQDSGGNPVSGAIVTVGDYGYVTSSEGVCRILTGKENVNLSITKSGYYSCSSVISATQIESAGKNLSLKYNLEEIITVEGYSVRNDNYMAFYIPCDGNNAYYFYYVSYKTDGMEITVDIIDDAIVAGNSVLGMNDNIEFVMQKNSKTVGFDAGNSLDVLVVLGGNGHWVRYAKNTTEFSSDISSSLLESGEFYYRRTERNKSTDGYNGYSVTVKLAYSCWGLNYATALGNITIMPAGRNGNTFGKSYFRFYVEKDCIWGYSNTAVRIEPDGKPVNNYFNLVDFEEVLPTLKTYKEGTTLENNMAKAESTSGDVVREYVSGALLFSDRFYMLHEDGIPSSLNGKSFFRGSMMSARDFTVTVAGYMVMAVPAIGSYSELGAVYCKNKGFERIAGNMPTIGYYTTGIGFVSETMDYFIKWCEVGESYSLQRWGIVIFDEEQSYEKDVWMSDCATVYKLNTEELCKEYAPSTRLWQGIPGIETMVKEDGSVRLWASWFTGNTKEPQAGNYAVYYYSDDDGKNWTPAYVVAFDSKNEKYSDCRVFDPSVFVSEDNELYIWWNQTNSGLSQSSIWYSKIANASDDFADMSAEEPRYTSNGLKMNKPTKLSSGEWIYTAHDFDDACKTKVYSSSDKGVTWTLKGVAYVPNARFANETAIAESCDENGNVVLIMWNRCTHSYCVSICYSYDLGITWTIPVEFEITGPSSRINARTLESGNIVYVHHYYTEEREKLTIFLSDDQGKTWKHALILDVRTGVSYPDIAVDDNGNIYVTWDYNRYGEKQILFAKITEAELLTINGVKTMDSMRIGIISSLTTKGVSVSEITGIVSDGEQAIQGATVTLISPDGERHSTTTDENGKYSFIDLPAECYEVTVEARGFYSFSISPFSDTLYCDSEFATITVATICLSAEQFVSISGKVINEVSEQVIVNATVTIGDSSVTTDENGCFTIEGVLIGDYSISVTADGYNKYVLSCNTDTYQEQLYLLPLNTTYIGTTGGTNSVVNSKIYLTRSSTDVIFTMQSEDFDTTNGTDRFELFINTSVFNSTRGCETMLVQFYSNGDISLRYFPNNSNTVLAEGNQSVTYSGSTLVATISQRILTLSIPYKVFEAILNLEYADNNYTVNNRTPIGINVLSNKKISGTWKSALWYYENIYGFDDYSGEISRFNPKAYIIVTPQDTLVKCYSDYISGTVLSSVQNLDYYLKNTSVYQENTSLLTDMGSWDTSDKDIVVFEDKAYFYDNRTNHQIIGGIIPAFEGMTINWDGVDEESVLTVNKAGYFLMFIRSDRTASTEWEIIIDSLVPNPGIDVSSSTTFSLYAVWANVGDVIMVTADAVILTNGMTE